MLISDWSSDVCYSDLTVALQRIRSNVPQLVVSLGAEDGGLPVKIIANDHSDDVWEGLLSAMREARARGRAVAVHAVSAPALAVVLAALEEVGVVAGDRRSEEHTSELQSLMRNSSAVF